MRFCWADKLVLALLVLLSLAMIFIGATSGLITANWWSTFAATLFLLSAKFLLPLWLALRVLDLLGSHKLRR